MTLKWATRIAISLIYVSYTASDVIFFNKLHGVAKYGSLGFIILGGVWVNFTAVRGTLLFCRSKFAPGDELKEFFWVFYVALLNLVLFASLYNMFGLVHNGKVITGDWYQSLYFSLVTWTTLGYGDFAPVAELRLVAALEAMLGYMYMAFFVGLLLNISQKATSKCPANNAINTDD